MYGFRGTSSAVRESPPPYDPRDDPHRFPADAVLADLEHAGGADAPARITRILARYAALRHWVLRAGNAPAAVTDHALGSARAYLAAASLGHASACESGNAREAWSEGALLLRILQSSPDRAGAMLAAAAVEARAAGDEHGAGALRASAREAAGLRLRSRGEPPGE